ncbi:MAG: hypothetical protein E7032_06900 [Akkermansiaceae bacterium]|nr:hypothetical protein [Akkermansiaceae bacterium]
MMEEEKSAEPSAPLEEGELEFRPWVKWCGIGLAGAASVGFFLATYYVGHSQGKESGFHEAISSGLVEKTLNETASRNVLSFLRLSSATDEHLLQCAADVESAFSWIKAPEIRMEAEWHLAQVLLLRGLHEAAHAVISPLFQRIPSETEWAHRALESGNHFVNACLFDHARTCFKRAARVFAENKQPVWQQEAQGQLIAVEACAPQSGEAALKALESILNELKAEDEGTRQLRSMALVHIGTLHRCCGNAEAAQQKFREALAAAENLRTVRPEGAVSRGAALLELGDAKAAEPMLRMAESNPGNSLSDAASRALALRYLSIIEQQRGHHVTALAMLHRAQGIAEGRIQSGNAFWPCLYDQRGWMHYMVQNYQTALQDFTAALATTKEATLLIQPQEGAARCYLELGKTAEALPLLENCLNLRRLHTPQDKNALGRLNLLLGQLYDQQGKNAEAETAYRVAVENLAGDTPDEQENRLTALLGHAYVLTELQRWAEAYAAWEQVLPLVNDQFDRREEARTQMRRIKPLIPAAQPAGEPAPAQS